MHYLARTYRIHLGWFECTLFKGGDSSGCSTAARGAVASIFVRVAISDSCFTAQHSQMILPPALPVKSRLFFLFFLSSWRNLMFIYHPSDRLQVSYRPIHAAIPLNLNKCCNKDSRCRRTCFQQLTRFVSISAASIPQKQGHFGHWAPCSRSKLLHYCRGKKSIQRKRKEINACVCTHAFRESAKEGKNVRMMCSICWIKIGGGLWLDQSSAAKQASWD